MEITSKIEVWDDYTKTSFTEYTSTQLFTIFIEPCIVNAIDMVPLTDLVYNIGDVGGALSGAFSFT